MNHLKLLNTEYLQMKYAIICNMIILIELIINCNKDKLLVLE